MEGFGSADVTTPFHYGSVEDSMRHSESLEHRLRKKYWKTKQTVLQKLGKNQDEFVVAGDQGIDSKLEKAYHLKTSCHDLLLALDRYSSKVRVATTQEEVMGEYLRVWSETEYTNAGEVMQNVGRLQQEDSKTRLSLLPSLLRMQSEFLVFQDSAVRDLQHSIELLEKSRTDYRAALLWMKDVSEKLRNPDYRDQLVRFREAQAAVKETKGRFEKLKHDLSEKIDMVSASRCNLLSRSLPTYQNELLKFSDSMANEFHKILVDLRSHHHHQYKVKRLFEEIRDLESEETAVAEDRYFSELVLSPTSSSPADGKVDRQSEDDDDQLLDIGQGTPQHENEREMLNTLEDLQHDARINDLVLGGSNAGLETVSPPTPEHQKPLSEELPVAATDGTEESLGDFGDLLQVDSDTQARENEDILSNEWSKFSAFMPETKTDPHTSPTAGWEKHFLVPSSSGGVLDPLASSGSSAQPTSIVAHATGGSSGSGATDLATAQAAPSEVKSSEEHIDELLGLTEAKEKEVAPAPNTSSLLSDDLQAFGITPAPPTTQSTTMPPLPPPPPPQSNDLELSSLDAAYFQQYTATTQSQPQQQPQQLTQPLAPRLTGATSTFRSPLPSSIGPIIIPRQLPLPGVGRKMAPALEKDAPSKKPLLGRGKPRQEQKGTSWMNVFQHLDPLVNEKA